MLRFLLQRPWLRRSASAVLGLLLGWLLLVGWNAWNQRSLASLAAALRRAHAERDIAAMERLFCW